MYIDLSYHELVMLRIIINARLRMEKDILFGVKDLLVAELCNHNIIQWTPLQKKIDRHIDHYFSQNNDIAEIINREIMANKKGESNDTDI